MKYQLLVAALLLPPAGCGVANFAAQQSNWNKSHGMGSMNGMPNMGGSSTSSSSQEEGDAAVQARIKRGEDLENEEARQAGVGPSPTEGMNCTTSSSSTGTPIAGTSTSHTTCHN